MLFKTVYLKSEFEFIFLTDSSFFSAVDILDEALPTLRKYGIKLYEFNCKNSAAEICKSTEETQSLLLFRYIDANTAAMHGA